MPYYDEAEPPHGTGWRHPSEQIKRKRYRNTGWDEMLKTESVLTKRKPAEILEWLFLGTSGIYLLCQCIYNSTYVIPAYSFPNRQQFAYVLALVAIPVLLKAWLNREWSIRILFLTVTAGVCFLAYRTGRELFLLMIPLMIIGAAGMDYRRVLRMFILVVGSFLLVTVLSAFTGVIPNLVYVRGGMLRSSWGIAYPTDFASMVLYLVMMIWLAWDGLSDLFAVLGTICTFGVARFITESRTCMLCSILLLCFVLLRLLLRYLDRKTDGFGKLGKVLQLFLAFSFVFFAAVFFFALMLFAGGSGAGITLDRLLSHRLMLTLEIFRDQGLHPFGSNYSPVGLGGSVIQPENYYFLDSSYPLLLIRYGWVLFLTMTALWTGMGIKACRAGDRKLLFVMTVIAFHALSEHHFLDVQYNILLILPFSVIPYTEKAPSEWKSFITYIRENGIPAVCILAAIAISAFFMRTVLSRLRTVFGVWGTDTAGKEIKAIAWICLLLFVSIGSGVTICRLCTNLRLRKKSVWKNAVSAAVCLTVSAGITINDSRVIRSAGETTALFTPEAAGAYQLMLASADGNVCAEDLPELVCSRFPGVSRSVWYGDDLARMKNASIVLSLREDRQTFADKGFLFTEISQDSAVYSNDAGVIAAMAEAGYQWTDYDAATREVDLQKLAELNGLELSEQGSILLENGKKLIHGPYVDLFQGSYQVSFELKKHFDMDEKNNVCTLYVSEYSGHVLAEESVSAGCFGRDGTAIIKLSFRTSGSRYIRFAVFPEGEEPLEVTAIHYQKTAR